MTGVTTKSQGTILFIDNKPKNLVLFIGRLDEEGYEVLVATSGPKGLELAEYAHPDIILLDVRMPEMDGFETCRRLKANQLTRDIPVIFLTALEETVNKVEGFEAGAVDYLTKSAHPEEVSARVGVHIRLRRTQIDLQQASKEAQKVAVLEERQRLARDLHDSVAQSLYSLFLLADGGDRLSRVGKLDSPQAYFADLADIALQTLKELRLLVYELRPLLLVEEGLVGALQNRLDAVENRAGIEARLLVNGDIDLKEAEEEAFFGIAREAMNNAIRHAQAGQLNVSVQRQENRTILEVSDDGVGFDPEAVKGKGGMGLNAMKERAQLVSMDLSIQSAEGEGTRVQAVLEST
jgi:signal transduction histidine kinase